MTFRPLLVLPVLGLLAACATTAPPPGPMAGHPVNTPESEPGAEADLEPVYAVSMGKAGVTVRVNSNGCTRKEDFQTTVLPGFPGATFILQRKKPDLCRAFVAGGADIVFSYADLRIRPSTALVLANPLSADPTPGR